MGKGDMAAGVTSNEPWTAVDAYINDLCVPPDQSLDAALKDSTEAVSP
jgi:hypothetical protein